MKLSEAIAKLEENPKLKFEYRSWGFCYTLRCGEDTYFFLEARDSTGKVIGSNLGAGGFNGNIKADGEWRQVVEPVDFMTAVNSGKKIRPVPQDWTVYPFRPSRYFFVAMTDNSNMGMNYLKYINGEWEIEP